MTSKECEKQLRSLIEHFNNGGLDFNATDIKAIEHLLLENQMQHTEIQRLKNCLKQANKVKDEERRRKELIQNKRNMYKAKYKKAQQRIDKVIDKLYLWGEILDKDFQKEMLEILKGDSNE